MRASCVLAVVASLLAFGCAAATPDVEVGPGSEEESALETRNIALSLAASGDGLEVKDEPRLKSGARGSLECTAPYVGVEGKRYACKRGSERLEILLRDDDATLLYKDGTAKRELFGCTGGSAALECVTKRVPSSSGGLSSPFKSTVRGVTVRNAHAIEGSSLLLRGMAPRTPAEWDELEGAGVKAVLIFKNPTGNGDDVSEEIAELDSRGITGARRLHVPFRWKELASFKESCEQTVEALKFLKARERARQKTFFHCTVGEDRTGLLAAMVRLVDAPSSDPRELFQREMCERGYGSGNPQKPFVVTRELADGLTPLYRKLAFLVRSGALSASRLDAAACENDPIDTSEFEADETVSAASYRCGTSTAFAL